MLFSCILELKRITCVRHAIMCVKMTSWTCFFFYVVLVLIENVHCKGQISLDTYSFDKILSKFKTSLIKFDIAFPYGPKHEEFLKVAESSVLVNDFLVAEVGVKDYGDKDNEDLAKRYNINTKEFPVYLLFTQNKAEPFVFKGITDDDYTADKVTNFVRSKDTGIYIGAPGCLEDFDRIAKQFITSSSYDDRKSLLKDAENLWDNVKNLSAQKSAEIYVKTMRKIIDTNDNEFLIREKSRLNKLLYEKVARQKKEELKKRINILDSFALFLKTKDEL